MPRAKFIRDEAQLLDALRDTPPYGDEDCDYV